MRFVRWATRYASTTLPALADLVERPENLPRLGAKKAPTALDIWLPRATRANLAAVHGSGVWDPSLDDRARYAAIYLLAQNGEAGVMCSVACTDGLARALRALAKDERSRAILAAIEGATPKSYLHGAQFVTEVQGGSDAGTNRVRAEPQKDGSWRLFGQKWFCSNLTADHWLVTARPKGAPEGVRGLALFLVPKRIGRRPNGHVVERLKDKVGTRALPTAELRFEGAHAWPLGALDAGLKNMVGIVLTTSRVHNTLASAALLRTAARHAKAYATTRVAFGRPIAERPLIADVLARVQGEADRCEAGAFALVDTWIAGPREGLAGAWSRVLVSVAKAVTARRASRLTYEAMMVLGGNGIEERFGPLPRLWRDAAIFETWEGPYTLLLMQALEDLQRFEVRGKEDAFLRHGLEAAALPSDAAVLARILEQPGDPQRIHEWQLLAERLWDQFADASLRRLRAVP